MQDDLSKMADLNTWTQQLSAQTLPILASTREQLKQLMDNENLSISVYAGPVLHDPGMASIVLRDVNKTKASQGRDPIGTISNAMPHLGPARIKQHLQKAVLLDDLKLSTRHYDGYMRYLTQACHGAFQARDWGMLRQTIEPEEMELATLLQNIAELALWCFSGDTMLQIEHRQHIEKQSYEQAARDVLGCDMRELGKQLAKAWHLPELCIEGLSSDYTGFTLATGVALASRLARLSSTNWYNKQTLACVQAIADYQGHSIAEVEHHLHINALNFTDYMPQLSAWAPARLLLMGADEHYIDRQYEWQGGGDNAAEPEVEKPEEKNSARPDVIKARTLKKRIPVSELSEEKIAAAREKLKQQKLKTPSAGQPVSAEAENKKPVKSKPVSSGQAAQKTDNTPKEATPESPALPAHTPQEIARQIALLQALIKQHDSAAHVIQQAVNAAYSLGFERAAFIMKVPKKPELVARFFCQDESKHPLKPFKITLDKPHLFSLLMSKPQNIWLNDKNRAKYWNRLPANVKLALHNDAFFAVSIFSGPKPVGLMFVDKPGGELTAAEYKKFLGLCKLLSNGLVEIVQKRAATSGGKVS